MKQGITHGMALDAIVEYLEAHPNSTVEVVSVNAEKIASRASVRRALQNLEKAGLTYPTYSKAGKTLELAQQPGVHLVCRTCPSIETHKLEYDARKALVDGLGQILAKQNALGLMWNLVAEVSCESCAKPATRRRRATSFFWAKAHGPKDVIGSWPSTAANKRALVSWTARKRVSLNRQTWLKQKEADAARPGSRKPRGKVGRPPKAERPEGQE